MNIPLSDQILGCKVRQWMRLERCAHCDRLERSGLGMTLVGTYFCHRCYATQGGRLAEQIPIRHLTLEGFVSALLGEPKSRRPASAAEPDAGADR